MCNLFRPTTEISIESQPKRIILLFLLLLFLLLFLLSSFLVLVLCLMLLLLLVFQSLVKIGEVIAEILLTLFCCYCSHCFSCWPLQSLVKIVSMMNCIGKFFVNPSFCYVWLSRVVVEFGFWQKYDGHPMVSKVMWICYQLFSSHIFCN